MALGLKRESNKITALAIAGGGQTVLCYSESIPTVTAAKACYPSADNSNCIKRGRRVAGSQLTRLENKQSQSAMLCGKTVSDESFQGRSWILGQARRRGNPEASLIELAGRFRQNVKRVQSVRSESLAACASGDRRESSARYTSRSRTRFALSGLNKVAMRSQAPV